jgi:hypothetical protein
MSADFSKKLSSDVDQKVASTLVDGAAALTRCTEDAATQSCQSWCEGADHTKRVLMSSPWKL